MCYLSLCPSLAFLHQNLDRFQHLPDGCTHMSRYLCSSFILRDGIASIRKCGVCLFFWRPLLHLQELHGQIQEKIGSPGEEQITTTYNSKTLHNHPVDKAFGLDFLPRWCWMKGVCRSAHKHSKLPVVVVVRNILPVQYFVAEPLLEKGLLIPEQLAGLQLLAFLLWSTPLLVARFNSCPASLEKCPLPKQGNFFLTTFYLVFWDNQTRCTGYLPTLCKKW